MIIIILNIKNRLSKKQTLVIVNVNDDVLLEQRIISRWNWSHKFYKKNKMISTINDWALNLVWISHY